ncbi:MAG TPA: site-2 protease family protein [Candidatus Omnitrophota bacterium]|nr:site-2 protease family protein [Candidatus Omnitrophota bacterium]HPS20155.1 site-2 protease family protein [Candidatus Omnitrophota bacterium]
MKNSYKLIRVFGIDVEIHITFLLLLLFFFVVMGIRGVALILGVFFFVTVHELCHSIAAVRFGIKVRRIVLLPIGGVASMSELPKTPFQELIITLAGPLSNLAVIAIFYYPLKMLLGYDNLMYPFWVIFGNAPYTANASILAHVYWLNLVLAGFNLIPAFPMDGGRVLRAILTYKMGYKRATEIAVNLGHIFALFFAYLGIVHGHLFLLIIAVFIYMAASSEGLQVDVRETIKNFCVKDVLSKEFVAVPPDAPVSKILELAFHSRQEDFPVMDGDDLKGLISRADIIGALYSRDKDREITAGDIMRSDIVPVDITAKLTDVQEEMQKYGTMAMPVLKDGKVVGVVTIDDINRIYVMAGARLR